ncbi:hypothetical protein AXG93_938s1050 [Marchantia polymorpha subsp. ruderalis]|uniref:Uncharacterized protein n=1 Tax=Marchantia polymorpha subsp. ruderalis TaxID=1480154 RepID=A0A176VRM1_MARPO|nr:hypothetical protein AXG93_938s1050 [Marchantia polymorpha subsp. ruderalis]
MATTLTKLALALTLVHAVCASRQILQTAGCAGVSQYIIAPSYVYPCSITTPSCAWYSFSNGADIVIINPNSGPGKTANSDYVNLDTTMSPTGQDYTILNWGTNGPECFLKTASGNVPADNFVTFENSHASYASYAPAAYMAKYAPSRFYHIVYKVTQANLISTMTKSKKSRAGGVYITNDVLPNPYDTAPTPFTSYWKAQVAKAAASC